MTNAQKRAEILLRRIRSHPALYGDMGEQKEMQAARILNKCKLRLSPVFKERAERSEWLRGQRLLYTWA